MGQPLSQERRTARGDGTQHLAKCRPPYDECTRTSDTLVCLTFYEHCAYTELQPEPSKRLDCFGVRRPDRPRPSRLPKVDEFNVVVVGFDVFSEKDADGNEWESLNILYMGSSLHVVAVLGEANKKEPICGDCAKGVRARVGQLGWNARVRSHLRPCQELSLQIRKEPVGRSTHLRRRGQGRYLSQWQGREARWNLTEHVEQDLPHAPDSRTTRCSTRRKRTQQGKERALAEGRLLAHTHSCGYDADLPLLPEGADAHGGPRSARAVRKR